MAELAGGSCSPLCDMVRLQEPYVHSFRLQALFLTCFNFSLTYCPASQNVKSNTLSHQFAPASEDVEPENIIPPTVSGLPPSGDNTVILTIVDHFSKAV